MAGTVTVPPHQFLNLPLLHHEVSSSSLSEKRTYRPYLPHLPPHLHSKCRCEFNPAHPERCNRDTCFLELFIRYFANIGWPFEQCFASFRAPSIDANERNECCYCSSLFSPTFQETAALLERFYIPSSCSLLVYQFIYPALFFHFKTIRYTLRVFIRVYQVDIPGDIFPFLSHLLLRGWAAAPF
jgi:hypothetical protein